MATCPYPVTDAALEEMFERCSNSGRWGDDDELGTLNLIDEAARRHAASLVREGCVVCLGRPLPVNGSTVSAHPVVHRMLQAPDDTAAIDSVCLTPHDPQMTHVDALGHVFYNGRAYNGRRRDETLGPGGLSRLSVAAMRDGIFCRGVLLDVAAARGVTYLGADEFVTVEDLESAEQRAGVSAGRSDALVVHVGRAERIGAEQVPDLPAPRAGLHASVLEWLRDRDIAVFLGDCTERLPPEPSSIPLPLHQIGIAAMGLCLIDGALTSQLVAKCAQLARYEFLFCCTVPELPGASGFPVNPMCVF
jgi:kynurenine formamidase